jgi:PTH1 family peptidyl-tRNA hydrolase
MLLIVGLGNPGPGYLKNRHNVGFLAADQIADCHCFPKFPTSVSLYQGSQGEISSQKVLLIKPVTFMNNSGLAVKDAVNFFKLSPDQVLVIHDDLDLPPGEFRLKKGGGHGGHNGLRSISSHIGPDYWRLRIGIGHPSIKALVSDYVLSNFTPKDTWVEPLVEGIGVLIPHLIGDQGYKNGSTFMEELKIRLK